MSAAFHLNNREANRELNVTVEDQNITPRAEPTYLGVKMDWTLTFRRHLESLRQILISRVGLLMRLSGSSWGAATKTLRTSTATLALVHSTAEYCTPVGCRSNHTLLIDKLINDALRTVTGCLRPTPADILPILAGIELAGLRRKRATIAQACRAKEPNHVLHHRLHSRQTKPQRHLKSRGPFMPAALQLLRNLTRRYSKPMARPQMEQRMAKQSISPPQLHQRHQQQSIRNDTSKASLGQA